jgi:pimeloyl-ACP methyl ester carboxylesterase
MATFLLIHGSYQGGWIWKPVATRLRAAGHLVFAPSLDGCGERAPQCRAGITSETQARELADFLWSEDLHDVVLVGTSSGGIVLSKTAELARERIKRLMLVDALALMDGESTRDIVPESHKPQGQGIAAGPDRDERLARFLLDIEPELAAWAADRSTLHPIGASNEPIRLEKFWTQDWDASVVFCRQAGKPGEAHQRRAAAALKARWHEMDTGHYPMLSMPNELTQLILKG